MLSPRLCGILLLPFFSFSFSNAQDRYYAGALGGSSALSDSASSIVTPPARSSSYTPAIGPAAELLFGIHWTNYVSSEIDYRWNENDVTLNALQVSPAASYQQRFSSHQNAVLGSLLLYFRDRGSWVRPYLSVGTGVVEVSAAPSGPSSGAGLEPPAAFHSSAIPLDVAVGVDVRVHSGWALRYSFAETTRSNPFGERLSPPSGLMLKNFLNLVGFVRYF
jgi:opacity protein-like surface antigen